MYIGLCKENEEVVINVASHIVNYITRVGVAICHQRSHAHDTIIPNIFILYFSFLFILLY